MRKMIFGILGIIVVSLLLATPPFAQVRGAVRQEAAKSPGPGPEGRLALLIGNAGYTHGGSLKNPVNDVRDMKAALEGLGFRVMKHENCTQRSMKKAIDEFGEALRGYEVGLFFYAGHGVQVGGENYLIPVDAELQSEKVVEYDCVRADRVLAMMEGAGSKTSIVILDACRDNPFERSWRRGGAGRGLAVMNAPSGALIAYATAPGRTALDGEGRNGVYTSALLDHVKTAGITIEQMFKRVRVSVEDKTNRAQTPWESTSLRGDFYFQAGGAAVARVDAPRPSAAADPLAEERARLEREREELARLKTQEERRRIEEAKFKRIALRSLPTSLAHVDVKNMIEKYDFPVRASNPKGKFPKEHKDNGDGTITDQVTGLVWEKEGAPSLSYREAQSRIEKINERKMGGHGSWRIPTLEELCSLLDSTPNPKGYYIPSVFMAPQGVCWTSDIDALHRDSIAGKHRFTVNFSNGEISAALSELPILQQGTVWFPQRLYLKAVRTGMQP